MRVVRRPNKVLTIQLRQFERPPKGGRMRMSESKSVTIHDAEMATVYAAIAKALGLEGDRAGVPAKRRGQSEGH